MILFVAVDLKQVNALGRNFPWKKPVLCPCCGFRCPQCYCFHTATNDKTNLARCFDCKKNFNPIDLVMAVGKYDFIDAVEYLKSKLS